MKVTTRQARVLNNLDRIIMRTRGKRLIPTIDGEDCLFQLFSLGARGMVVLDDTGEWIRIADPDGIVGAPYWPVPKQLVKRESGTS